MCVVKSGKKTLKKAIADLIFKDAKLSQHVNYQIFTLWNVFALIE